MLEIATVYVRSLIGILAASAVTALMIVKSGGSVDAEMFAAYLGAVVAMVLLGEKAKSLSG